MTGFIGTYAQSAIIGATSGEPSEDIPDFDLDIHVYDREIGWDERRGLPRDRTTVVGWNAIWPCPDNEPDRRWHVYHNGTGKWVATPEEARELIRRWVAETWRFWEEKVRWLKAGGTEEGRQVIRCGGEHYVVGTGGSGGFGGRAFTWRLLDTGKVVKSNDMWWQGVIPTEFADRLPDNAEQLPTETIRWTADTAGGA